MQGENEDENQNPDESTTSFEQPTISDEPEILITEEREISLPQENKKQQTEPSFLPLSLIAAALIIGGSILYAAKMVVSRFPQPSAFSTSTSQASPQSGAPAAPAPQTAIPTDRSDAPVIGNPKASITIEEFSDFQCPFCEQFYKQTYPQIKSQYIDTGKAKLVYRYFPLTSIHVNAEKSAEAAQCAYVQGKFEDYYNLLFTNGQPDGTNLDVASLKKYAQKLNLDTAKFNQCLDSGQSAAIVNADINAGLAGGVEGTPTFYINGKILVGAQNFSAFSQLLSQK